jgi:hypothetical protein
MAMGSSGHAFAPYVERFLTMVESGEIKHGMDSTVFTILGGAAKGDPNGARFHPCL